MNQYYVRKIVYFLMQTWKVEYGIKYFEWYDTCHDTIDVNASGQVTAIVISFSFYSTSEEEIWSEAMVELGR